MNKRDVMRRAWRYFKQAAHKNGNASFSEALKKAWKWAKAQTANRERIEATASAAGIAEVFHSWAGWQALGRMVIHGEHAAFKVLIDTPERGEGKTMVQSFFTYNQTQPAPAM